MQLGENTHRTRRKIVIGIILTFAVIQIIFGLIGILGTYYASTQVNSALQTLDRTISQINNIKNDITGIQNYTSSMSTKMHDIGSGIDINILGWRPFSGIAQYFYDTSTALDQATKTTQDVGQTLQETSATLTQFKTTITSYMPYMFLYLYLLHGMFLLNGVMWILFVQVISSAWHAPTQKVAVEQKYKSPREPLTNKVFCRWCGTQIPIDSDYCPKCGRSQR